MKSILITDPHLGIKKGDSIYLDSVVDLFNFVCKYSKKNDIKSIMILGDFFDTRKSLSLMVIDIAIKVMDKLSSTFDDVYMIVGNHDTFLKTQLHPTSISIFKKYDNVHIIDKPTEVENILMLPWLFDTDVLLNSSANICMGHFDISGMPMNASGYTQFKNKLKISDFKEFDVVFSGHYHVKSKKSNIVYLGSPLQFTFNEINEKTGFYEFDSESLDLEFIEFDNYPKHIILNDTDEFKSEVIKGNNISLVFTKDHGLSGNIKILNSVRELCPNELIPHYYSVFDTSENTESTNFNVMSKLDILMEYYNEIEIPDYVNKNILTKMVKKLYDEAADDGIV